MRIVLYVHKLLPTTYTVHLLFLTLIIPLVSISLQLVSFPSICNHSSGMAVSRLLARESSSRPGRPASSSPGTERILFPFRYSFFKLFIHHNTDHTYAAAVAEVTYLWSAAVLRGTSSMRFELSDSVSSVRESLETASGMAVILFCLTYGARTTAPVSMSKQANLSHKCLRDARSRQPSGMQSRPLLSRAYSQ